MGGEFGQFDEWKDYDGLDWECFDIRCISHERLVKDLNAAYLQDEALWEQDHSSSGFEWIDVNNAGQCMLSFPRTGKLQRPTVSDCNFSRQSPFTYTELALRYPAISIDVEQRR